MGLWNWILESEIDYPISLRLVTLLMILHQAVELYLDQFLLYQTLRDSYSLRKIDLMVPRHQCLTKEVSLDTPATSLDCKLTANVFSNDNVKVMYKIRPDGSNENFNDLVWEYFNGTGLSDKNSEVIPNNLKTLSPSVEDLDSYLEYGYSANNQTILIVHRLYLLVIILHLLLE